MNTQSTTESLDTEFGGTEAGMARRLLALNRAPRPALLARVRAIPAEPRRAPAPRRLPRLAWAAIAAALLLVGLVAVSPPLRAALGVLQERIGDLYLSITDRLPESSEVVVYDYEWIPLDQAPFQFGLPGYVPEGWTMDDRVGLNHLRGEDTNDVLVRWTRSDHAHVFMSVFPIAGDPPSNTLVGVGSYREIEINGRPAVIVHGGWDSETGEWGHPNATNVIWAAGGLQYSLFSSEPAVSDAELVRMAESVP